MLTSTQTAKEKRLARQLAELTDRLSREVPAFRDASPGDIRRRYAETADSTEAFGRTYLPHYFGSTSATYHADLDAMMERHVGGTPLRHIHAVHGPREHAKSSRCRATLIRRLLTGRVRYYLLGSEALTLAKKHVEYIYVELTDNRRLAADYDIKVTKWDSVEGVLRCRVTVRATGRSHTFQLEAVSYGRAVKGRLFMATRPQGCLLDDFENTRTARNERISREKVGWVLQELYPAVTGPIVWLGNTGHDTSALYLTMLRTFGGDEEALRSFLRAGTAPGCLSSDASQSPLSNGLERQSAPATNDGGEDSDVDDSDDGAEAQISAYSYRADTTHADGSVTYLWPERYPPQWYAETSATMGPNLYEGEMNGLPIREGTYFKSEWFTSYDELPTDIELSWYLRFDPAFGKTASACFKAVVVIASSATEHFVVDAWMRQTDPISDGIGWMYRTFRRYPELRRGGYENDFGQEDRLRRDFSDAEATYGEPLPMAGDGTRGNKEARIESLQPLASQGRIRFPRVMTPDVKVLYNQLLAYPDGFVDGPDVLESAIARNRTSASDKPFYLALGPKRRHAFVKR